MSRPFSNETIPVPIYVYAFKVDGKRRLAWADSPPTTAYVKMIRADYRDSLIESLVRAAKEYEEERRTLEDNLCMTDAQKKLIRAIDNYEGIFVKDKP